MSSQERLNVSLDVSCEALPPAKSCGLCGGETDKVQELKHWVRGTSTIVVASGLPGYRCQECGVGWFDPSTTLKFLKEAKKHFTRPEETTIKKVIEREIASRQELLNKNSTDNCPR